MVIAHEHRRASSRKTPMGLLVAVGGNEDKKQDLFILRSTVSLVRKDEGSPYRSGQMIFSLIQGILL